MNASAANWKIFKRKIFVLLNYFSNKTLNDGYSPTIINFTLSKILQSIFIPSKLIEIFRILFASLLLLQRTGDILLITIVEMFVDMVSLEFFNYFVLFLDLLCFLKLFTSIRHKLDIINDVNWILYVFCYLGNACCNNKKR